MQIPRPRKKNVDIDLSPLIDCVFLLLLFFMVSSTLLSPAIPLELASAEATEAPQQPEILITVDPEGRFYINNEQVSEAELQPRLQEVLTQSERKIVTFSGSADMAHKHFVTALNASKQAGAKSIDVQHTNAE